MKTEDPFMRYSRQIFIEKIGVAGQRNIQQASVLVVGAGGLGSPVIQYLAAAGVGTLGVADFDSVELHNLNRQVIHSEKSIGNAKADSAAVFVNNLNSLVCFSGHKKKIDAFNAEEIIAKYDIVVDGSDNFTSRYIINDTCVTLKKPLVYGSISAFEGQLAVFNLNGSKNLRDLFPEAPDDAEMQNCDRNGVLGPLPGIIGSMMALQVLKIITGLPADTDQLTLIDTLNWNFMKIRF